MKDDNYTVCLEWLKSAVKDGYWQYYRDNADKDYVNSNDLSLAISSFEWSESPQEHILWAKVNLTWLKYLETLKLNQEKIKETMKKEKTNYELCLEWLKKNSPKDVWEYYRDDADKKRVNSGDLINSIWYAFLWRDSPQKYSYWERLDLDWRKEQDQTPHQNNNSNPSFKTLLDAFWSDYRDFLLKKDSEYGSLYLNPLNKLINLSPKDRVLSRLEEKIGRLYNGNLDDNTIDDIFGLILHLKVIEKRDEHEKG